MYHYGADLRRSKMQARQSWPWGVFLGEELVNGPLFHEPAIVPCFGLADSFNAPRCRTWVITWQREGGKSS